MAGCNAMLSEFERCEFLEIDFLSSYFAALPAAPTNLQASEITATSVKLTWSYPDPDDLTYYVIRYGPKTPLKNSRLQVHEMSGIVTMYYSLRPLSPYTEYEIQVIAVNQVGRGPPSAPITVRTGETGQYEKSSPMRNTNIFLASR